MADAPPEADAVPPRRPEARGGSRLRRVKWRRLIVVLAAFCVLVVGAVVVTTSVLFGQIHRVKIRFAAPQDQPSISPVAGAATSTPTQSASAAAPSASGTNYLLMGSDSRDFAGGQSYNVAPGNAAFVTGQRSDVVMLLHIPADNGKSTVVSFPRDSWVLMPAYTDAKGVDHEAVYAKLNAAFAIGGAPLLVATMEQLTGLHIDHFASVNFPGFQGMVNALGGIDVCIGTTRHDPNSGDFLTRGQHHVNGVQALAMVRDRESFPSQDLGRIKDQEYFLSVMLKKVLSAGTLTNPIKLTGFLDAATKSLTVDSGLSVGDMRKLASRFSHLDPSSVSFITVPIGNANYRATSTVYGNQPQDNVEIDPVASGALFGALATDSTVAPAPAASANATATAAAPPATPSATPNLSCAP